MHLAIRATSMHTILRIDGGKIITVRRLRGILSGQKLATKTAAMANVTRYHTAMAKPLVHFEITGSVETGLRFEQFPNNLRAALRDEIEALGREAFGQVAAAFRVRRGGSRARSAFHLGRP
jgi:hypothetical protein